MARVITRVLLLRNIVKRMNFCRTWVQGQKWRTFDFAGNKHEIISTDRCG